MAATAERDYNASPSTHNSQFFADSRTNGTQWSRQQIFEAVQKITNWVHGPGEKLLASQRDLPRNYDEADAIRKTHEQFEFKCMQALAVYAELNEQRKSESMSEELTQLDITVQDFLEKLQHRRTIVVSCYTFYRILNELDSQMSEIERLSREVDTNRLDSTQRTVALLEQGLKTCETRLVSLKNEFDRIRGLLDSNHPALVANIEAGYANARDRVGEARQNVRLRILELMKEAKVLECARDTEQSVIWLEEQAGVLMETYRQNCVGRTPVETSDLLKQHEQLEKGSKDTYEFSQRLLQTYQMMCRGARRPADRAAVLAARVDRVWPRFCALLAEIRGRLEVTETVYRNVDSNLGRVEQLLLTISRELDANIGLAQVREKHQSERDEVVRNFEETRTIGFALMQRIKDKIGPEEEILNSSAIEQTQNVIKVKLYTLWVKIRELEYYLSGTGRRPSQGGRWGSWEEEEDIVVVVKMQVNKYFESLARWERDWTQGPLPRTLPQAEAALEKHAQVKREETDLWSRVTAELAPLARGTRDIAAADPAVVKAASDLLRQAESRRTQWEQAWTEHQRQLRRRYDLLVILRDLDIDLEDCCGRLRELKETPIRDRATVESINTGIGELQEVVPRQETFIRNLFDEVKSVVGKDFDAILTPLSQKWENYKRNLTLLTQLNDMLGKILQFLPRFDAFKISWSSRVAACTDLPQVQSLLQEATSIVTAARQFDTDRLSRLATELYGNPSPVAWIIDRLKGNFETMVEIEEELEMVCTNWAPISIEKTSVQQTLPAQQLNLVRGLENVEERSGGRVVLQCLFNGLTSEPQVTWLRNGAELRPASTRGARETVAIDRAVLILTDFGPDQAGSYVCRVRDRVTGGQIESSAQVNTLPTLTAGLADTEAALGNRVTFQCNFEGFTEPPQVKWFHNGIPVQQTSPFPWQESVQVNRATLTSPALRPGDEGNYACVVRDRQTGLQLESTAGSGQSNSGMLITCVASERKPQVQALDSSCPPSSTSTMTLPPPCPTDNVEDGGTDTSTTAEVVRGRLLTWHPGSGSHQYQVFHVQPRMVNRVRAQLPTSWDAVPGHLTPTCDVKPEEEDAIAAEDSARLRLTPAAPATPFLITTKLGPLEALRGSGLNLEVAYTGMTEAPDAVWLHDNVRILPPGEGVGSNKWRQRTGINKASLSTDRVEPGDGGTYTCLLKDRRSGQQVETSGRVTVVSPPSFIRKLAPVTALEGDPVLLQCQLDHDSAAQITWYHGNKPMTNSPNIQLDNGDGVCAVKIAAVQLQQAGMYRCVARNAVGEVVTNAELTVKETRKPRIHKGVEMVEAPRIGQRLALQVNFDGQPPPEVAWLRDDKAIRDTPHTKIVTSANNSTLTLDPLTEGDGGVYSVVVKNPVGLDRAALELNVRKPPAFVRRLEDIELIEGDVIRLLCQLEQASRVRWFRGETEIRSGGNVVILADEPRPGSHSLIVRGAGQQDAGTYRVVAENDAGQAAASCAVRVNEVTVVPKILHGIEMRPGPQPKVGESLSLQANYDGQPHPDVAWYKNDRPLVDGPKTKIVTGPKRSVLTKEQVTEDDSGVYSVVVKNPVGSNKASKEIIIRAPPIIAQPPKDTEINDGEPVRLVCQLAPSNLRSSIGPVKVTWRKGTTELPGAQPRKYTILDDDPQPGSHALIIHKARPEDAGTYSVVVENDGGRAEASCDVRVESLSGCSTPAAPIIVEELKPQMTTSGDRVVLEARVMGHPPPQVFWTKDGQPVVPTTENKIEMTSHGPNYRLVIPSAHPEHCGTYRLTARNPAGHNQTECQVNVTGGEDFQQQRTTLIFTNTVVRNPPEFLQLFGDAICRAGETVVLSCIITGLPQPTVWWNYNGEFINSSRYQFVNNGDQYSLVISATTLEDSGRYSVTAENSSGVATCSALVVVEDHGRTGPSLSLSSTSHSISRPISPLLQSPLSNHSTLSYLAAQQARLEAMQQVQVSPRYLDDDAPGGLVFGEPSVGRKSPSMRSLLDSPGPGEWGKILKTPPTSARSTLNPQGHIRFSPNPTIIDRGQANSGSSLSRTPLPIPSPPPPPPVRVEQKPRVILLQEDPAGNLKESGTVRRGPAEQPLTIATSATTTTTYRYAAPLSQTGTKDATDSSRFSVVESSECDST